VDARAEGIEVVYQDLALCDNLTAAGNVFLGRELKRRVGPFTLLDYAPCTPASPSCSGAEIRDAARATSCARCPGGQRQAVAIARTRSRTPSSC
jgi:simple sugar transport system ATP-binding protein